MNINSFSFNPNAIRVESIDNESYHIKFKDFRNVDLTVSAKKISEMSLFSKFQIWLNEKIFGKTFVRLNANQEEK